MYVIPEDLVVGHLFPKLESLRNKERYKAPGTGEHV